MRIPPQIFILNYSKGAHMVNLKCPKFHRFLWGRLLANLRFRLRVLVSFKFRHIIVLCDL